MLTIRQIAWGVIVVFAIGVLAIYNIANADSLDLGYRIYTEAGGMGLHENGVSEGHKYYQLLGIEVSKDTPKRTWSIALEGFKRGEAADDDPEILNWGATIDGRMEGKFNSVFDSKFWEYVYPYIGVSYNHFERDENNAKDPDTKTFFEFAAAEAGVKIKYGIVWINLGTIIPFATNAQSGNFGIDSGIGITWKGTIDLAYRYKKIAFTDHHFHTGENDFDFTFSGVELAYNF